MQTQMQILFLDLETTGLNPERDQILEVGAVLETYPAVTPIDELPKFHVYVKHDCLRGNPFALAMNAKIIKMMADKESSKLFIPEEGIAIGLSEFLEVNPVAGDSITVGGKNVGMFDLRFLEQVSGFARKNGGLYLRRYGSDGSKDFRFSHRVVDPALMYYNPLLDTKLPNLQTCLDRAGIDSTVKHTAVDDALDCVKLMRHYYGVYI